MMQLEHEEVIKKIEESKAKITEANAKLADAKRGREDEDGERAKKLARLGELKKVKESMETELKSLKENDPQALADLEKEMKLVSEAANRWTDNIFSVRLSIVSKIR
jgi:DNA-binding ferritin-like protein